MTTPRIRPCPGFTGGMGGDLAYLRRKGYQLPGLPWAEL